MNARRAAVADPAPPSAVKPQREAVRPDPRLPNRALLAASLAALIAWAVFLVLVAWRVF